MVTASRRTPETAASRATVELRELEASDPRWGAFVAAHGAALAFHTPAWVESLADCYGHRAFVLAVMDGDDVAAGVPVIEVRTLRRRRRWVSLPFTDACPPLLTPSVDSGKFAAALAAARSAAAVDSFEVRAPLTEMHGAHPCCDAVTHTTRLSVEADELRKRFHRSQVQRNIRRAERESKLTIRRGDQARDLTETFYRLHVQTRRRLGMPVQPRRFFEALWSHVLAAGHGSLLLAETAGRTAVAGAVFLGGTATLTYKYGASDAAFWRLRPNHLLFWHAIRAACEDGYDSFDWGRTDLADVGLRTFKSGWAADESTLVYTTLADAAPQPRSGRGLAAARVVLRRSPTLACRVTGELLYRYAA
jgi:CelD/BcsL family acetyltransferase involved in cellulose biosynthesis